MNKKLKIGIVGCGAIGGSLAKAVARDFKTKAYLSGIYDIDIAKAETVSVAISGNRSLVKKNLGSIVRSADLVIEAASAKASCNIAQAALEAGCDAMVMSVGGLSGHIPALQKLACKVGRSVYIPSGAVCGIDALKALAAAGIKRVNLTTYKHPISFKGVEYVRRRGIDLEKIRTDTVLFSGTARQAVKYFPQNINVAMVLSLAGVGENKTRVTIIASPRSKRNVHEVRVVSAAGDVFARTENIVHPQNPKTSYLAVLSAVAMLRRIVEPVKIGT